MWQRRRAWAPNIQYSMDLPEANNLNRITDTDIQLHLSQEHRTRGIFGIVDQRDLGKSCDDLQPTSRNPQD